MFTLRRCFLSLSLAYLMVISLYLPTNTPKAASSKRSETNEAATVRFNSPHRIRLPVQETARGSKRERELLIRFRRSASPDQQRSVLASIGAREFKVLRGKSRVVRVILSTNQTIEAAAFTLRAQQLVEAAEPNYLIYQDHAGKRISSAQPDVATHPQQNSTPNDPRFNEQWALQNLGGNARLFGSDIQVTGVWPYSIGKRKLTVAVIDSGIDFNHPDLKNQQWKNRKEARNGKDEDGNGFVDDISGWNFLKDSPDAVDESGHGTNVAGIIAAEGNNGIGIAGVLWKASLMNLRVLDANGIGDVASAIEALDYATDQGAQVINLSWGSDAKSLFLKAAIGRASKYGAVVVCAAGNEARDLEIVPYYPASFDLPNMISVAASDASDSPVPTSNFGVGVPTIAAPGFEILTTKANIAGPKQPGENDNYELVTGTSAAAAIVSGVIGLFKSASFDLSPEEIKRGLLEHARTSYGLTRKNKAGGVVSVSAAFTATGPNGAGENGENKNQSSANPRNSTNTEEATTPSKNTSEQRKGSERAKRRRKIAGPDLPNLDLQKNVPPPRPHAIAGKTSSQRDCSPSLLTCDGRHAANPEWAVTTSDRTSNQMDSTRLTASSQFGWTRLVSAITRDEELKTLVPLMRKMIDRKSDLEGPSVDYVNNSFPNPYTITVDNFVTGFYQGALARDPSTTELTFWKNQVKDATSLGSADVLATAQYLGSALFLSADYAARNHTNNTDYVTDLYWGYYQHAPDSNLSYWVGQVSSNGREAVRLAFAGSSEFSTLVASIDVGSYPTATGSFSTARTDIVNRTGTGGEDLLSGNVNFGIPILSLPGRAGLHLKLGLSYNSRVWSKANSTVAFDTDRGFPAPGFRIGFPVVQPRFYNSATGTASFLLITPSGRHVELRQVGSSNVYEAADASYTHLTDNTSSLLIHTTDGTQMTYASSNGQWVCTEIKDRNGNYLTINYNSAGNISTIVDTLERTITFNYDGNGHLQTITQPWTVGGSSATHTWATFTHDNITIDTNFSGVYMLWPQDNTSMSVLTEVAFADGSHIEFEYNAFGQVNKVKGYASNDTLQSQTRYVYDTPSADVPRVTDRYTWARYWNGDTDGTVASGEEARAQFSTGLSGGVMTAPDNIEYKEFYASSGWQRGLTTTTEIWQGATKEKWATTSWDQDNTSVSYFVNPRITEMNVYDDADKRRKTTITYTDYSLPDVVTEYEADASTVYRKTDIDYVTTSTYINNRVIGLPSKIEIKDVSNNLKAKTEFTYDSSGEYFTNVTGKDKHDDTNYGSGFVTGRG